MLTTNLEPVYGLFVPILLLGGKEDELSFISALLLLLLP
jgi:hypothetical protein